MYNNRQQAPFCVSEYYVSGQVHGGSRYTAQQLIKGIRSKEKKQKNA